MAMMRCKQLEVEGDKLDRLTNLPINVQHRIQESLSIEEAARMSVLSRPWRHVWASIPKLVFSPHFCQSKPSDTLINVINTILLQHHGAIKTFHLNISSIPSSQHSVIDQWMFLLSRNGVMDLTLQNLDNKAPYRLSYPMYGVELERLSLSNCIFKPPCSFRGFHKLKKLSLLKVALEDVATSFLWMPNLVYLLVRGCSGFPNSKIYAPKLLQIFFLIWRTKPIELGHFMDCQKLKTVILASSRNNKDKVINLTYLLNCWPDVLHFNLDSYYLKSFATELERLPTCLNSLRALTLFEFDFDDDDQIFSLLGMLKSSPNLEDLLFLLSSKKNGGVEVNVNHFEGPACRTLGLNKLQQLKIDNFHGSRTEMLFVRSILSSAPLLLKTIINEDADSVHESQRLKISKELMGFPRASPKLEIICEQSEMDTDVLY
ncbi:F-box/FBD/LRR-repeat protein At1g13570-like isoform X1 [Lycium ferocissimum]|uniref:F-box/FBD/LRR-repeat protein At1g13570-like isoform X1 n=1 Tax=Lycium ferocissimum TaxID=112874 RepID=UPI002814B32A|nr:F-box/FBD/LRR-repeat protein At1g13570-like isoform X1 [Lycium ferocissimum]